MDEVYNFLIDLIDEFGAEGTISHDTFNKAVNLRSNIIADSELCDGENGDYRLFGESLPIRYCQQCGEPLSRNKHKTWCEHYSGNVR